MTKQIIKVIAAGMLAGVALFLMPFMLIRLLAIFLIVRVIFRLLGGNRRQWKERHANHFYPAFARRWHHMNDEQKKSFREKMENDFFNKI